MGNAMMFPTMTPTVELSRKSRFLRKRLSFQISFCFLIPASLLSKVSVLIPTTSPYSLSFSFNSFNETPTHGFASTEPSLASLTLFLAKKVSSSFPSDLFL